MTKTERKMLCGLMDVKKLTMEASMHAAQNEKLPLRVVVQVLFFEQVRAAARVHHNTNSNSRDVSHSATNTDEDLDKSDAEQRMSLQKQMSRAKIVDGSYPKNSKLMRKSSKSRSGIQLLPSRSRRIFDKLWIVGKAHGVNESKSSETSGSQSPGSIVQGDTKTARDRRHSIS